MAKDLKSLYKKYMDMQNQGQNMADGGKVEDDDSVLSNLADSFKKAFSTPAPSPTPDPTLQEKYQKVREQNRKNWEDPKNQALADGGIAGSTHTYQYAEGGEVEHDKTNLNELKAAFDKFLSEESKERKMSDGGEVEDLKNAGGKYADATNDTPEMKTERQSWQNPQTREEREIEAEETSKREDDKKFQDEEESKALKNGFAKGGKVLDANARKHIATKNFAGPDRSYPVENLSHARNALAKVAQHGSPTLQAKVRAKVHSKYPSIGMANGGKAKIPNDLDKLNANPLPLTNSNEKYMGNMFDSAEKDPVTELVNQGLPKYADGGQVNKAAPNNEKTGEYTDFDLYKKYLKMKNSEQHFDSGGKALDPAKIAQYKALYPGVSDQQVAAMIASEHPAVQTPPIPQSAAMSAQLPSPQASNTGSLAGNISDQLAQSQVGQGMADGGEAKEVPVDIEEPSVIVGDAPMKEEDAEVPEDSDDKAIEEEMANEDFGAGEKADDEGEKEPELTSAEEPEDADELANNSKENNPDVRQLEGMTLDHNEALKENPENKDESAGLQVSPEIQKAVETLESKPTNDLEKAQKERDFNVLNQEVAKYGALAGAGLLGKPGINVNPSEVLKTIGSNDQYANLPVQKYEEQIANQQNDPKSAMSQTVRNYLNAKGFKVTDNASASDLFKIAPFLQKDASLQQGIQKVIMQQMGAGQRAQLSAQTKSEIAQKNRDAAMERQKLANEGKLSAAKASQETKANNQEKNAEVKAETAMSTTRGKQAVMMAQRNLVSIQNAQKMLDEFPDTNKWTPGQVNLFNTEVGKIASGGVPTENQMNELSNPTLASHMAKYAQQLTNVPIGADQGKFIELNKKYLNGLNDVAHGIIRDNVGNVAKSYQSSLNPEAYKNMIYRHSDMLGLFTPAQERGISAVMQAKGLSRQDAITALVQQNALKDVNY